MNRRQLLKNTLITSAGLWASPLFHINKALAQNIAEENFLVVIIINGGWTVNLSIDPWLQKRPSENEIFLEYLESDIFQSGDQFFGPAMLSLKDYTSDMNIINGIFMSPTDTGHESSQMYAVTGNSSGKYANIAAEFEINSLEPKPLGVMNRSIPLYLGNSTVDISNINDLANVQISNSIEQPFLNPSSPITKALHVKSNYSNNFQNLLDEQKKISEENIQLNNFHTLALSFKYGLSRSSSITIDSEQGTLDTHGAHPGNHLTAQTSCWNQVKDIFDAFKKIEYRQGQRVYDRTTFFITSEFSRTPALDASKGTNHNPLCNSAIIMGPNFTKNKKIGSSRLVLSSESVNGQSYLTSQMINPQTFEVIKTKSEAQNIGKLLGPEYVIATLAEGLKIQRNLFAPLSLDQKPLTTLIK